MSKCIKCGAELEDGAKFCPECGEKQEQPAAESAQAQKTENTQTNDQAQNQNQNANTGAAPGANASDIGDKLKKLNDTADTTDEFDKADIESNKVMAVLAYLSWLVLIPLIGAQKSGSHPRDNRDRVGRCQRGRQDDHPHGVLAHRSRVPRDDNQFAPRACKSRLPRPQHYRYRQRGERQGKAAPCHRKVHSYKVMNRERLSARVDSLFSVRPACATTKWRKITTLLFRVRWLL